jgi:hypothetical protein
MHYAYACVRTRVMTLYGMDASGMGDNIKNASLSTVTVTVFVRVFECDVVFIFVNILGVFVSVFEMTSRSTEGSTSAPLLASMGCLSLLIRRLFA